MREWHLPRPCLHPCLQVSLSLDHVSTSLALSRRTLESKLTQTRQRLVELAAFLPYASSINTRNVGSHARTIIRLSALVGSIDDGDGGGSGGNEAQAAAPAPQEQPAAPPAGQQTQQQAEAPQQAQPTAAAEQQDSGEPAGRQKRARLHEPASACGPADAAAAVAAPPDPGEPR